MFVATLEMNSINQVIQEHGFNDYGYMQRFVDSEILRLVEPYVPFQVGILRTSGITNTIIGSGELVWSTLYAQMLWYGKKMIGPAPRTVTETDLIFHGGALTGAFWVLRMWEDRGQEIIKSAEEICKRGGP